MGVFAVLNRSRCISVFFGLAVFAAGVGPTAAQDAQQWNSPRELIQYLDVSYKSGEHEAVVRGLVDVLDQERIGELYLPAMDWVQNTIAIRSAPADYAAAYMIMLWAGRNSDPEQMGTAAIMYFYSLIRKIEGFARCDDNGVTPLVQGIRTHGAQIVEWYKGIPRAKRMEIVEGVMLTAKVAPMHPDEFRVCANGSGYTLRYLKEHGSEGITKEVSPEGVTIVRASYDPELVRFIDDADWKKLRASVLSQFHETHSK